MRVLYCLLSICALAPFASVRCRCQTRKAEIHLFCYSENFSAHTRTHTWPILNRCLVFVALASNVVVNDLNKRIDRICAPWLRMPLVRSRCRRRDLPPSLSPSFCLIYIQHYMVAHFWGHTAHAAIVYTHVMQRASVWLCVCLCGNRNK